MRRPLSDDAVVIANEDSEPIQHGRFARTGTAADQDILAAHNRLPQRRQNARWHRADADQLVRGKQARLELANRQHCSVTERGGITAATRDLFGELRIEQRLLFADLFPQSGNRSARAGNARAILRTATWRRSGMEGPWVSSTYPRRLRKTRQRAVDHDFRGVSFEDQYSMD